jgi:hypothetical protein
MLGSVVYNVMKELKSLSHPVRLSSDPYNAMIDLVRQHIEEDQNLQGK